MMKNMPESNNVSRNWTFAGPGRAFQNGLLFGLLCLAFFWRTSDRESDQLGAPA